MSMNIPKTARKMLIGAGTISFDHKVRSYRGKSTRDALAEDWKAVGGDLRKAMLGYRSGAL